MFDKNFYPTPKHIVAKMLEPYHENFSDRIILEPSAGKGDILDYIEETKHCRLNMFCIEKNPDLQAVLKGKKYKLIDTDFLRHNADFDYNLIVMNPPFENGDEHLLKAWGILEAGDVVCLLNEETIKNPYSKKRKLLKDIISENGTIEYLGDCFAKAERKTGAGVALVRLHKKSTKNKFRFDDINEQETIKFDDDFTENSIATRDIIENICIQYKQVKEDYLELCKIKNKVKSYTDNLTGRDWEFEKNQDLKFGEEDYLEFINELKEKIWANIARELKFDKYMTSDVRSNFSTHIRECGSLGITKKNITEFVAFLFNNRFAILEQSIGSVFDMFTKYHEENRVHVEGWKTNSKWKVTKKVILPYCVEYCDYSHKFRASYRMYSEFRDIDKCMSYLKGKDFEKIDLLDDCIKGALLGEINESEFFEFRCYKKGTIHLIFKDEWLWKEFNMRACAGKNWLPEAEKKTWREETKAL